MNDIKEVYFRIRKSKEYNLLKNSILDETPCSTDDQSYVYLIIPKNLIFQMHYLVLSQSIHIMKLLLIMWSSKPVSDTKEFNILKLPKPVFYIFEKLDEDDRDYIDNIINLIDKG